MNNRTADDCITSGDIATAVDSIQMAFTNECRSVPGADDDKQGDNKTTEKTTNGGGADDSLTEAQRVALELFPKLTIEQLQPYCLIAERNVRRLTEIKTLPEADVETETRKLIEASEIGKLRGSSSEPIGIIYDPKLSGEAITRPRIRLPPFKEENCRSLVRAVLSARESPTEINSGDVYVFFDGGKTGLSSALVRLRAGVAWRCRGEGRGYD